MSDFLSNIGNKIKDAVISPALQAGVEFGEEIGEKWVAFLMKLASS